MAARIRLISWNLHGTPVAPRVLPRLRAAATELSRRAPDLVLLQEIWRAGQADFLARRLAPDFERVGAGPTGDDGRAGGLLAFVRPGSGWRVRRLAFVPYRSEAPAWKIWEGDGLASKGLQILELERSGLSLIAINTHLQASYRPGGYTDVRRKQLTQLGEVVREIDTSRPVIAAGDLNCRPDEAALYPAIESVFEDLTRPLRQTCACGTVPGRQTWLDYVLARRSTAWRARARIDLIRSERADYPYSDHHALDASIELESLDRGAVPRGVRAAQVLWGPASRRAWLVAAAQTVRHRMGGGLGL